MGIHPPNPIAEAMQGLGKTKPVNPVNRDHENTPQGRAAPPEATPGDRISLSEAPPTKVPVEPPRVRDAGRHREGADLSEEDAARLAQAVSTTLARMNTSIAQRAIQQSVDLFT